MKKPQPLKPSAEYEDDRQRKQDLEVCYSFVRFIEELLVLGTCITFTVALFIYFGG